MTEHRPAGRLPTPPPVQTGRSVGVSMACYNEEEAVETVVREAVEELAQTTGDWEIVVVDDGSTDRSAAILDRLALEIRRLRVIHHPHRLGFGGFLKSLILNATRDYVFQVSSDGEFRMHEMRRMIPLLDAGADIVVGVRSDKQYGAYRMLVSSGYNRLVRMMFGDELRDPGSCRMVRLAPYRRLKVVSGSAFVNAERLIRARRRGFRIEQVKVDKYPRLGGRPKGGHPMVVLGATFDLFRVWWDLKRHPETAAKRGGVHG